MSSVVLSPPVKVPPGSETSHLSHRGARGNWYLFHVAHHDSLSIRVLTHISDAVTGQYIYPVLWSGCLGAWAWSIPALLEHGGDGKAQRLVVMPRINAPLHPHQKAPLLSVSLCSSSCSKLASIFVRHVLNRTCIVLALSPSLVP